MDEIVNYTTKLVMIDKLFLVSKQERNQTIDKYIYSSNIKYYLNNLNIKLTLKREL